MKKGSGTILRSNSAIISYLGSKRLSIILLKVAVIYFSYLTILWIMNMVPPAPFMFWGPFFVWMVIFLANLLISLLTRKYIYKGNIIFHAALFLIAAGAITSYFFRFSGEAILTEGNTFFGEEKEYQRYFSRTGFQKTAPALSFKLYKITPEYWKDELYFIKLEALVKYPAETLAHNSLVYLNDGPTINGARLRLTGFGFFPEVIIEEKGRLVVKRLAALMVFPPGNRDVIKIKDYEIYVKILSDPKEINGRYQNLSMNLTEPVFRVGVVWFNQEIYNGVLKKGEPLRFGDMSISFTGVKYWVTVGIVKDPGEVMVFAGFIIGILGLILRLFLKKAETGR